jgi:hypothetical protein
MFDLKACGAVKCCCDNQNKDVTIGDVNVTIRVYYQMQASVTGIFDKDMWKTKGELARKLRAACTRQLESVPFGNRKVYHHDA